MTAMFAIAWRELRNLFLSPFAWTILAMVQLVLAWRFLTLVQYVLDVQPRLAASQSSVGVTDMVAANLFNFAAIVMLFVTPLLTMGLIAGERRGCRLTLLRTAPLSSATIVLGKYLGVLGFLALLVLLVGSMPLALLLGAPLDLGVVATGVLGMFLVVAAFAAVGLYASAVAGYPAVAAVISFAVLLFLWIADWAGELADEATLFTYLSLFGHYRSLLGGLIDSRDLVYFGLIISLFLVLAVRRFESERVAG